MKTTETQADALCIHEMKGELKLSRKTKAAIEAARAEQPESHAIDLWEDNAGGLAIVCRASGVGFCGFERGQNVTRLRVAGRDEFTFASDATPDNFAELGEGSLYFFSDGVTDVRGSDRQVIGLDGVRELFERHAAAGPEARLRGIVSALRHLRLADDTTIVLLEDRRA